MNRFSFTGTVSIPKEDAKRPFCREFEKNGNKMISLNFSVRKNDSNREFVELFGSERDTINTINKDGEKIEVDWADRFNKEILDTIPSYKKSTVALGEERVEFLSQYDAAKYLAENLPNYKGRVTITGQMNRQFYGGKYYNKYVIDNVFAARETAGNSLSVVADVVFNRDCVDKTDWSSDKKIILNGYIESFVPAERKNMWFPQTFVFDVNQYDLGDERVRKQIDFIRNIIDTPSRKMVKMRFICGVLNGAEEVKFDESCLTPIQREQVEIGLCKLEDFRPRGTIYGDRKSEIRITRPDMSADEYKDGVVDTEMSFEEFEENVFKPMEVEKLSDVVEEPKAAAPDISDDDLFGI